jgi:hypothetical protein
MAIPVVVVPSVEDSRRDGENNKGRFSQYIYRTLLGRHHVGVRAPRERERTHKQNRKENRPHLQSGLPLRQR